LKKFEFTVFPNDEFYFIYLNKKFVVILYVDDIQYFGESFNDIFDIERQLEQIFKITNIRDIIFYLGMNIYYDREIDICYFN
jgi:hypothetical protein